MTIFKLEQEGIAPLWRGKSGLHGQGAGVKPGRGNLANRATENKPPLKG